MLYTIRFFREQVPTALTRLGREVIELPAELLDGLVRAMDFADLLDSELARPRIPGWPPASLKLDPERAEHLYFLLSDLEADDDDVPDELPDVTPDERAALAAYAALTDSIRSAGSPVSGRVPRYKFESPDNWRVTPTECNDIAQGLARLLEDEEAMSKLLAELEDSMVPVGLAGETLDWLPDWQATNAHGARHQGYIVF